MESKELPESSQHCNIKKFIPSLLRSKQLLQSAMELEYNNTEKTWPCGSYSNHVSYAFDKNIHRNKSYYDDLKNLSDFSFTRHTEKLCKGYPKRVSEMPYWQSYQNDFI